MMHYNADDEKDLTPTSINITGNRAQKKSNGGWEHPA